MKTCVRCGSTNIGPQGRCRPCNAAWMRNYNKDPNAVRARFARNLQYLYGITVEDWARMYEAQGGKCFGCERPLRFDRTTHVDHSHRYGDVRGLLCDPCNHIVGLAKDDPITLHRLSDYLFASLGFG